MLANDIFQIGDIGDPIPSEAAIYLIKYFKDVEGWGPSKTKSVAFRLDDLEAILAQVNSIRGNGVRIYFGKYPTIDIPNLNLPNDSYKGRNTIVFVPTVDDGSGGFLNYFEVEREVLKPVFPTIPPAGGTTPAYNHGQLEP